MGYIRAIEPYLISVDVETAGPAPGRYAMLEIGACVVDQPELAFTVRLRPDREAFVPEALAVSSLDLEELGRTGVEPGDAMAAFARWVEGVTPDGMRPLMVGLNVPFDWMFVADYFDRYLGRNPFGHAALDIKALSMGVDGVFWDETSWADLSRRHSAPAALTHSAVQDATDQAAIVRALLVQLAQRMGRDRGGPSS